MQRNTALIDHLQLPGLQWHTDMFDQLGWLKTESPTSTDADALGCKEKKDYYIDWTTLYTSPAPHSDECVLVYMYCHYLTFLTEVFLFGQSLFSTSWRNTKHWICFSGRELLIEADPSSQDSLKKHRSLTSIVIRPDNLQSFKSLSFIERLQWFYVHLFDISKGPQSHLRKSQKTLQTSIESPGWMCLIAFLRKPKWVFYMVFTGMFGTCLNMYIYI